MIHTNHCNFFLALLGVSIFIGCSGIIQSLPRTSENQPSKEVVAQKEIDTLIQTDSLVSKIQKEEELDFSLAFVEPSVPTPFDFDIFDYPTQSEDDSGSKKNIAPPPIPKSKTKSTIAISRNKVRVLLNQNCKKKVIYSLGIVDVYSRGQTIPFSCNGRIVLSLRSPINDSMTVSLKTVHLKEQEVFLPCTLLAKSMQNYIELDDKSYRGSLILVPGKGGTFSVINYCDVEEYLRGVVPLEIGRRSSNEKEAVKAQAVAARTYTYKKMIENKRKPFDLYATVRDQVYGGIQAEHSSCDNAIYLTKDKVLIYKGTLIYAYYHSTCGGITANIRDVWNKGRAIPYLCSVKDINSQGKAYCSLSHNYTWSQSWDFSTLSHLIKKYTKKNKKSTNNFSGTIRDINIEGRFPCGRVSKIHIKTTVDTYTYSGDFIRFKLIRDTKKNSILYSSRFNIVAMNNNSIQIKGYGYGHGIGMCQMGAIGRARVGQSFEKILQTYYPGSTICHVNVFPSF